MRAKNSEKQVLEELHSLDALIRQGQGGEARRRLQVLLQTPRLRRTALQVAKVPLSRLLRRVGLQSIVLKILRDKRDFELRRLPPDEMLEYALCLAQLGAQEEALSHLTRLHRLTPVQQLRQKTYLGFVHQNRWDYGAAQTCLEEVSAINKDLSDYEGLVAHMNLVFCYAQNVEVEKGLSLLAELLPITRKNNYRLLTGSLLSYQMQLYLSAKDKRAARGVGVEALDKLAGMGTLDQIMAEKAWLLSAAAPDVGQLRALRERAWKGGFFETVRDCDFQIARLTKNESELVRLWIGTPFEAFRLRILTAMKGQRPEPPWEATLSDSSSRNEGNSFFLDPRQESSAFEGQSLSNRLIEVLTLDLYRPMRAPTIFQRLHPDEFYDPFHTPARLHQALHRLRRELSAARSLARVISSRNGWRMVPRQAEARVVVRCYRDMDGRWESFNRAQAQYHQVLDFIARCPQFRRQHVEAALGISARMANLLLSEALQRQRVEKIGNGRSTSYVAVSPR